MEKRKYGAVNLYEEEDIRVRKRLSMSSEEKGEFHHKFLTKTGLCAHSDAYNELLVTTSNRVPKIRTKMWDEIATQLAGDADAYHRALTFKDDETFRTTLKNAVITALNAVENSVLAGLPLCKGDIADPVVCAAIQATLTELGGQTLTKDKYTAKSSEDVFGIRAGLEAVLKQHHGMTLNMFKGAVTIWPVDSIRTPEGLTKKLHEQHDDFLYGVLKKTGEIMRLDASALRFHTFPAEAQNIAGDLRVNLASFYEAVIKSHKYMFCSHQIKYVTETVDTGEIRVIAGSAAEVDAYLEFRDADQEITATP